MRNIVIIIMIALISWFLYTKYAPKEKEKNAAVEYVNNLKTSQDKAVEAKDTVNLTMLRSAITQFRGSQGRYPDSLQELVEKGFLSRIPSGDFKYDKNTGEIR